MKSVQRYRMASVRGGGARCIRLLTRAVRWGVGGAVMREVLRCVGSGGARSTVWAFPHRDTVPRPSGSGCGSGAPGYPLAHARGTVGYAVRWLK